MNNINRHNYETFFLLYTDNELSAAEKKEVEKFVATNPDLQEELVMLEQSILKPDTIVFEDKNCLLKNEFIPTRIQEKLLLLLDDELTAGEKNELDGLINADDDIKSEWNLLQQTKLLKGTAIVFEDKQSLYRQESGRVIAFSWWRVAVAAVFIGFGLWGALAYFNGRGTVGDKGIVVRIPPKSMQETVKTAPTTIPVMPTAVKKTAIAIAGVSTKKTALAAAQPSPQKALRRLAGRDNQPGIAIEKNNNLPEPYSDNLNKIGSNENVPAYVTHESKPALNNDIVTTKEKEINANEYAAATSFADKGEEDNNRILFMDEAKIKKTKLGGIFRKVKRVLERSANIKPGDNNIKVANLEFTIQ